MSISLVIVLALALSFAFARVAERYGLTQPGRSGVEYLLLGVILGPHVSAVVDRSALATLAPFFSVILGVVGFRMGLLLHGPSRTWRSAGPGVLTAVFTGATVTGVTLLAQELLELGSSTSHWFAVELGAIAMTANETAIRYRSGRLGARGPVTDQLFATAAAMNVTAVIFFGAALALARGDAPLPGFQPGGVAWFGVSLLVGGATGFLHHWFVQKNEGEDKQFLAIVAVLVFGSGIAFALGLSPLFVTIIAGILVGRSTPVGDPLHRMVDRLEAPLEVLLLLAVGLSLAPLTGSGWFLVVAFPLVRLLAVRIGARFGHRSGMGRGLAGVGVLSVAIALEFVLLGGAEGSALEAAPSSGALVVNAVILSLLVTDLLAGAQLRAVLADAGELHLVPQPEPSAGLLGAEPPRPQPGPRAGPA